jgi:hypothetical protein
VGGKVLLVDRVVLVVVEAVAVAPPAVMELLVRVTAVAVVLRVV